MPINETLNYGRELLDQFGKEGEGWRVLNLDEAHNDAGRKNLPEELLIPVISDQEIAEMGKHLVPASPVPVGPWTLLKEIPDDVHARNTAFNMMEPTNGIIGVVESAQTIHTLHTWGYYGIFKPSIAEVLGKLNDSDSYQPAPVGVEYFWTELANPDMKKEGNLWPNRTLEVYAGGENYIIDNGAYHLGRTAVFQVMPHGILSLSILSDHLQSLSPQQ